MTGAAAAPSRLRSWLAPLGPALMVSVGYMDPGNWATDLEGGARFGYELLWVLVLSNVMALLLQGASARLGIVSGHDLATACRAHYGRSLNVTLWLLAEVAIIACDLAEIVGSAVALNLLFDVPLVVGALLTALDVFLIMMFQRRGLRRLEAVVLAFVSVVALCLLAELILARPALHDIASGLRPRLRVESLYVAIGILGATVMPHNLYLHSALERERGPYQSDAQRRAVLKKSTLSTAFALHVALLLNGAILVVAAAVFAPRGLPVSDLGEAHALLTPLLGTHWAALLFAVALLCSGQSATITGTLAGQVVMEGFLQLRMTPVKRRLITRGLAIVPAVAVLAWSGQDGTMGLLVASQVVLSFQLPFAIVPLIRFTSSSQVMGSFAVSPLVRAGTIACATLVVAANVALLSHVATGLLARTPVAAFVLLGLLCASLVLLVVLALVPFGGQKAPLGPTRLWLAQDAD